MAEIMYESRGLGSYEDVVKREIIQTVRDQMGITSLLGGYILTALNRIDALIGIWAARSRWYSATVAITG